MRKLLFIHYQMLMGGVEKSLIALLNTLPAKDFDISLLLMNDEGPLIHEIPSHVHLLPPLSVLFEFTPEQRKCYENEGKWEWIAEWDHLQQENKTRAQNGQSKGMLIENKWQHLRKFCPEYSGYDIALAYSNVMALRVLAQKVSARKKVSFNQCDYRSFVIEPELQEPYLAEMDSILFDAESSTTSGQVIFPSLANRISHLPNLLPLEEIRTQADAFFPEVFTPKTKNIFTIARLVRQKGIDLIIQAAKQMKNNNIEFQWLIAGGNTLKGQPDYRMMASDEGVDDVVFFLGEVLNPYPYLKHCDLYVQPSRYEGKPLSIDIAQILGRPVLATRYSTVSDSIQHGVDGYICEMEPSSIASSIEYLLKAPHELQKIAQNGTHKTIQYDQSVIGYMQLLAADEAHEGDISNEI